MLASIASEPALSPKNPISELAESSPSSPNKPWLDPPSDYHSQPSANSARVASEVPCEFAWVEGPPPGFQELPPHVPAYRGRVREDSGTPSLSPRELPGMSREDSASSEGSPRDK